MQLQISKAAAREKETKERQRVEPRRINATKGSVCQTWTEVDSVSEILPLKVMKHLL